MNTVLFHFVERNQIGPQQEVYWATPQAIQHPVSQGTTYTAQNLRRKDVFGEQGPHIKRRPLI